MLIHVVSDSGNVLAIESVLRQLDKGYDRLTAPNHNFSIHNVYVSKILKLLPKFVVYVSKNIKVTT